MIDPSKVRDAIERAALAQGLSGTNARDVAFHMTDWIDDLESLHRLCAEPEAFSPKDVESLLWGFLVHVPAHLAAAAKLYTGVPVTDVFGIGAVSETG